MFVIFNNSIRCFFLLVCINFLSGCETTQSSAVGAALGKTLGKVLIGESLQSNNTNGNGNLNPTSDPRQGIRSIADTELAGLFSTKPLRMSDGRNAQYPRVAITVDQYAAETLRKPRYDECYFMHARIWDSATKSRNVAPFSVCMKDVKEPVGGFLRADTRLNIWNSGIATAGQNHTGSTRTEGPQFPQRPVPSGPLDAIGISPSDTAYFFVHGTLTTMNFDFTQADPRVWFVNFSKLDAAGFQAYKSSAGVQPMPIPNAEIKAAPQPGSLGTTPNKKSSSSKGREISCSPDVVRPGDTLIIKTNRAFADLGVRVPDKNVNFILLVAGSYPEGLVSSDTLKKQMGLEVNVSEAKVKPGTRIFTKDGVYGFVVSTNLETDDGTPSFECKVRYISK